MYHELLRIHNVRWLAVVKFLTNLIFYSTVIVAFEASRGLRFTGMFGLESVLSAAIFLFEVPTGVWADRLGYRRLLILGQGLFFASALLYASAYGFWLFAASSALYGMGLACLSGCDSALVYESIPAGERERLAPAAFSLLGAAGSGGFFCGLAAGSFLGAATPAMAVYVTAAATGSAFLASFRLRPVTAGHREPERPAHFLKEAGRLIRQDPAMAGLSLFSSAAFALANSAFWYNQPLMARVGIPVAWFGPLTALAVALQMLAALAAPHAERVLGRPGALAVSCLIPGAAYLLLARAVAPAAVTAFLALVIAGGAWRSPLQDAELNRRIPDGARATTLSALSFLGTAAGILLNPLIGLAGDLGVGTAAAIMGAGLILLGALPPLLIRVR